MPKTAKKPQKNQESRASRSGRIARMFSFKRAAAQTRSAPPHRFSRANQPKKNMGRPLGALNLFTREIKEAAVNAATRYGADGHGLGGLEGFFFRCCDLHPTIMVSLLGRICPMQKAPDGERKTVYRTPEEFDEALKARGLPSLHA